MIEVREKYYLVKVINKILYYDTQKNNAEEIIKSIVNSRFYIEYIDRKNKAVYNNPRYERYLNLKYLAYLKYIVPEDKRKVFPHIKESQPQTYLNVDEVYRKFLEEKKDIDDYSFIDEERKEIRIYIEIDEENEEIIIDDSELFEGPEPEIIYTKEDEYASLGIDYINRLVSKDIEHLNEEFLYKNHTTILLPSFLIKSNEKYLNNIVCLNIYDCGIINIKVLLADERKESLFKKDDLSLTEEMYERVELPKPLLNYKPIDFFNKDVFYDVNINDITNEYFLILKNILREVHLEKDYNTTQLEFYTMKDDKLTDEEVAILLFNSHQSYIKGFKENHLADIKEKQITMDRKNIQVYSSNVSLIQHIEKRSLISLNKDEDISEEQYPSILMLNSIENSRIYEIAIIKKSFYYNLYTKIKNITQENLDINKFKEIINIKEIFEMNYNQTSIYQEKTSYRTLYKKICRNLFEEYNYKDKVDKEENRINEIIAKKESIEEQNIKTGKIFISLVVSLLTIVGSMMVIPDLIQLIGKGLKEQINVKKINIIGDYLIKKNIIISMLFTLILVIATVYIIIKYFKREKNKK